MIILKKHIYLLLLMSFIFNFPKLAYCSDVFTYTNKDYGFSIDIPANWSVTPKSELPKGFQLVAVSENLNATLSLYAIDRDPRIPILSNMTITQLNSFVQGYNSKMPSDGSFKYVQYRIVKVNQYDCLELIYDEKDQGRMIVLIFVEDSCAVEICYLVKKKDLTNLLPSMKVSLTSIEFFPVKLLKA